MADKYINATQMMIDESEAYMEAQLTVDEITRGINEIVHRKLQQLLIDGQEEDVVEVKHSEWETAIGYDPQKTVQCQNCFKMNYEPTNYCPNCGTRMDGEKNG